MLRIAVLASGRGSNLQAMIDAIAAGTLDACITGVFSDNAASPALRRAVDAGIPARALDPTSFGKRSAFDAAFFGQVEASQPDVIVCAGYMRLISAPAVRERRGRLLNIHPSLLPDFKGLHTHAQALAAGVHEHGASVHYITPDLDGGPVIAQARVPVLTGDAADALARRVLGREHVLLLATLRLFAAGRVTLVDDAVCVDGRPLPTPLQLAANNDFS